jgi:hypothetical protein
LNQNNTSAGGYLILGQTGGNSTKLSVDTSGNAVFAGSVTVQSASGLILGSSSTASKAVFYSNGNNTISLQGSSSLSGNLTIFLPGSLGSANQCLMNTGTAGVLQFGPCGGGSTTASVTLSPEFAGATLTGDGSSNTGTMTSDFCGNDGAGSFTDINTGVCNTSGDFHNYYSWTSTGAND